MELVFFWVVVALICAMVAGSKKGGETGFVFFFYGLIIWPIALVHALLLSAADSQTQAMAKDLKVAGKRNWRPLSARVQITYADPKIGRRAHVVQLFGLGEGRDASGWARRLWIHGEMNGQPAAFRVDRIKELIDAQTGEVADDPAGWLRARENHSGDGRA